MVTFPHNGRLGEHEKAVTGGHITLSLSMLFVIIKAYAGGRFLPSLLGDINASASEGAAYVRQRTVVPLWASMHVNTTLQASNFTGVGLDEPLKESSHEIALLCLQVYHR